MIELTPRNVDSASNSSLCSAWPGTSTPSLLRCHVHLFNREALLQAEHNLSFTKHNLPDPSLTPRGEKQCQSLRTIFPYHEKIDMLVSSPLRRTLYTTLIAFEPEVNRGLKVVALPEVQETSGMPCDTGSDVEALQKEFGDSGKVDLSLLPEGWNEKVSEGEIQLPQLADDRPIHSVDLFDLHKANMAVHRARPANGLQIMMRL